MTCQSNPNMICYFLSVIKFCVILTTVHPIDLAEDMAKFKFSAFWKIFNGCFLLIDNSGMVPGTATLINLLNTKWLTITKYHQQLHLSYFFH